MSANTAKSKSWLIAVAAFCVAAVIAYAVYTRYLAVPATPALNEPFPSFSLPVVDANQATQPASSVSHTDFPKQPFLLNVWGSWCITCAAEHPFLMKLAADGVPIVGVNYGDEYDDAVMYLKDHGDPFLFTAQDVDGVLANNLGLVGAPETFVIDASGNIRQRISGEITADNWQNSISPCMQALGTGDIKAVNRACQ